MEQPVLGFDDLMMMLDWCAVPIFEPQTVANPVEANNLIKHYSLLKQRYLHQLKTFIDSSDSANKQEVKDKRVELEDYCDIAFLDALSKIESLVEQES